MINRPGSGQSGLREVSHNGIGDGRLTRDPRDISGVASSLRVNASGPQRTSSRASAMSASEAKADIAWRALPVRCFDIGAVESWPPRRTHQRPALEFFTAINSFCGSRHNRRHNTCTALIFKAFLYQNIPCAMVLRLITRSPR